MTEAELRRAFARRQAAAGQRGDHDLDPELRPEGALRPAAVLVPIVLHAEEPTILLTLRTPHLHAHAGQIAFPGGGVDPGDADRRATALRETQEEVGLDPAMVEIVGQLDTYVTRTGFEVVPYVGLLLPPLLLAPDPFEVADIFEIPLSFVLGPGQPERHSRAFQGRERSFWAFPWRDRYVWGATAGMLRDLRHALIGEDAA